MKRKTVLTLVNGTWAEKANWIKRNSEFSLSLNGLVPDGVEIEPFSWKAPNRHNVRLEAAERLVRHIKNINMTYKNRGEDIDHFVIAHSHGGNVAMLACKDEHVMQSRAGVICMATPFLYFRYSVSVISINSLAAMFATVFSVAYLFGEITLLTEGDPIDVVWFTVAALTLSLVLFSLIFMDKRSFIDITEDLSLPRIDQEKVLIVRSIGDEAGGAIAGSAMLTWLTVFLSNLTHMTIEMVFRKLLMSWSWRIALGVIVTAFVFANYYFKDSLWHSDFQANLPTNINIIGLFVFAVVPTLLAGVRMILMASSGYDVPFRYPGFLVTAEVIPTTGQYVVNMETSFSEKSYRKISIYNWEKMKHSEVYQNPKVINDIATWIDQRKFQAHFERHGCVAKKIMCDAKTLKPVYIEEYPD